MQPSSVASERVFSAAGALLSPKRCSMTGASASKSHFLRYTYPRSGLGSKFAEWLLENHFDTLEPIHEKVISTEEGGVESEEDERDGVIEDFEDFQATYL